MKGEYMKGWSIIGIGVLGTVLLFTARTSEASPLIANTYSEVQQSTILSLTSIAENSQTTFDWGYAENIGDGRGITFGIIGFTSGTYDGTMLIQRINELDSSNVLTSYLPAFEAIDASPHNSDGLSNDTTGLDNFIADFNVHGADPIVKQAQLEKQDELYWQPAVAKAEEVGAQYAITLGELYDISVNHGEDGIQQLVRQTDTAMGGTPADGVNETDWLEELLNVRLEYMQSDPTWADALDRVYMYERILGADNVDLSVPLQVTCYGDPFTIYGNEIKGLGDSPGTGNNPSGNQDTSPVPEPGTMLLFGAGLVGLAEYLRNDKKRDKIDK